MKLHILVTAGVLLSGLALAQTTPKLPEFEVASIKPAITDIAAVGPGTVDAVMPDLNVGAGGIVTIVNLNIRNLVMLAYGVGGKQISAPSWQGDPEWQNNRFTIVPRVPVDANKEDVPLMLQALLAERFHLAVHREQKEAAVYALEIGKGPLKIRETKTEEKSAPSACTRSYGSQPAWFVANCTAMAPARMAQAIQSLAPGYFDKPVVDATGLTGVYDFSVEWAMKPFVENGGEGPTIFDAVEKLGLKFESMKHTMEIIVVDHCEKQATAN